MRLSHTSTLSPGNVPDSDIYVQVDTREMEKLFSVIPEKIALASKRAAVRTREWLLTNIRRELSKRSALPANGIRGRFRRGPKGNDGQFYSNEGYAVLWIGLDPVEAQRAGAPTQTKQGTRVRRHMFDRAFVAKIGSGTDKVWRRKGPERFPVIKMTIPINEEMEEILPKYEVAATRMFSQRLEHEVNYLLGLS